MTKAKKGFTLIEVVVVMAIIAVLAVLVVGAIGIARRMARDTQRRNDLKNFQVALEAYRSKKGSYDIPNTFGELYRTDFCDRERFDDEDFEPAWNALNMGFTLPEDPHPGYRYTIHMDEDYKNYVLVAHLEGGGQSETEFYDVLARNNIDPAWRPYNCTGYEFNYAVGSE